MYDIPVDSGNVLPQKTTAGVVGLRAVMLPLPAFALLYSAMADTMRNFVLQNCRGYQGLTVLFMN